MPVSPARAAAFDILLQVEQEAAYASELLHSARYAKLSPADHHLTTELSLGVLRWRSLLDQQIADYSSQRLEKLDLQVLIALRLAVYQILFLRVPQRAAVHESVELVKRARKRSAASFANAVLRKLADSAEKHSLTPISDASTAIELSAYSAHPLWLVERWSRDFGHDSARQICLYNQHSPETVIRLARMTAEAELKKNGVEIADGKLLASARRVQSGDVTRTAAFHERRVFIQDEASQLVALLVGNGSNILDCCAAPGGKTGALANRNPGATIVAAELHPHRARLLQKLVPAENVRVIAADVRRLPISRRFDRVLADVPCSGTGTLARNPEIKWHLKPADLMDLQSRQLGILSSAMEHVAPGGRLVYSTCSLEREENEDVIEMALAADSSFRIIDCHRELHRLHAEGELLWKNPDSLTRGSFLRTIPGVPPCDGFFAAIVEKGH